MSTINSWKSVIQTPNNPVLKRGGPSSSKTLNTINQNIKSDIVSLNAQIQDLDRTQQLLAVYLEQQAVGIQSIVGHLQTLIPSNPSGRGVADFFSSTYIDATNTAYIDQTFGQATLPILSVEEKMYSVDTQGNVWIPNDSRLMFMTQDTYTAGVIPDDSLFFSSVEDYKGIGSQSDQFFLGGVLQTESYVYLKAVLPQTLNSNNLSNQITFYPISAFSHSLVGAYYRLTDGSWNFIEIDYLLEYDGSVVPFLGPTKLHFPAQEITQVLLVLQCTGYWGVQEFSVSLVTYGSAATLAVNMSDFSPTDINNVILGGISPTVLNGFPITVTGDIVSVALSQISQYVSPVINLVDCRWAA